MYPRATIRTTTINTKATVIKDKPFFGPSEGGMTTEGVWAGSGTWGAAVGGGTKAGPGAGGGTTGAGVSFCKFGVTGCELFGSIFKFIHKLIQFARDFNIANSDSLA